MSKYKKTSDLRDAFLTFFKERGHQVVPSSSLVPTEDPTLLFTNAGMVPFKNVFLGLEQRPYQRAVSVQRCVRAGGKHNDLENVGYTARHHTFFEMLGHFSFGDYFKEQAIRYAWEFLTQTLGLPPEKLWVTVFREDEEAADIWLNIIKVDPTRFSRCDEADNFWSMGDTGPCGPCTEIFYDHGESIAGGPPGSVDQDGDRYVEIWNLVFMQYDRSSGGELSALPKPSVDTGMGLERIAAVMQGVHSNFDIDIFQYLIKAAARVLSTKDQNHTSLKVIADHIRASGFLIMDGVIPGNEGRNYVLRRIIRRALRHGYTLGCHQPFLHRLVEPLVAVMSEGYPELTQHQTLIQTVLLKEEKQFLKTLSQGLDLLEDALKSLSGKTLSGDTIFKLYDTYGFPVDLTQDIAREKSLTLDLMGFEQAMQEQRQRSKQASHFQMDLSKGEHVTQTTEFIGYDQLVEHDTVSALYVDERSVERIEAGQLASVVLNKTPFYAESGGQVGDSGELLGENSRFIVNDTQKKSNAHTHRGQLAQGTLTVGDRVQAKVDTQRRQAIRLNHSATHLLHATLRFVLGEHVRQKGSLVEAERLRFDFTHYEPIDASQLKRIEKTVNENIRANWSVVTEKMTPEQAQASGALALFNEKYTEEVRVLSMGNFSKELCGGTHVTRTGDIGLLVITQEMGIASGVRRIEAKTGEGALQHVQQLAEQVSQASDLLKTSPKHWLEKLAQHMAQQKVLTKQISELQSQLTQSMGMELAEQAVDIEGVKVLAVELPDMDASALRETVDRMKSRLGDRSVVVLASAHEDRVHVVAGISKACAAEMPVAKELITPICGKGGGRPDLAQGGGKKPPDLAKRLAEIPKLVETWIKRSE